MRDSKGDPDRKVRELGRQGLAHVTEAHDGNTSTPCDSLNLSDKCRFDGARTGLSNGCSCGHHHLAFRMVTIRLVFPLPGNPAI